MSVLVYLATSSRMADTSCPVISVKEEKPLTRFATRDWMVVILLYISFLTFSSLRLYTKNTIMRLIVTRVIVMERRITAFTLDL